MGGDGRPGVVYQVDFGPAATCAKGFLPIESNASDERFFWKGPALSMRDRGGDDLLNRDFVRGEHAELTVGLDNGHYDVEITFGDRDYPKGPFNVPENQPDKKSITVEKKVIIPSKIRRFRVPTSGY